MSGFFSIIIRYWKPLGVLNVVILMSALAFKMFASPQVWLAHARFIIPETNTKLDANLGVLGSLRNENITVSQLINPRDLQIAILTSDVVMQKVLLSDPDRELFADVDDFKKVYSISPIDGTTGFSIHTQAEEKDLALQRISLLVNTFDARLQELRTSESSARNTFSSDKLSQAEQQLNLAKEKLIRFQEESGVVDADTQIQNLLKSIDVLQAEYDQAALSAIADVSQLRALEERVGMSLEQSIVALGLDANPSYQYIKQQLTEVSSKLANARATFTDESPQVRSLVRKQLELENQLLRIVGESALPVNVNPSLTSGAEGRRELIQKMVILASQVEAQQSKATRLKDLIDELNNSLNVFPKVKAQLETLQRDYDLAEGVYKGLVAQAQQSNINAFTAYPNVQLLDPPRVYLKPTSLRLIIINAVLASVLASSALVLFLENRDPRIVPNDLKTVRFDLVSEIPWFSGFQGSFHSKRGEDAPLPIHIQYLGSSIANNLSTPSSLLVTSADCGEGKTTITSGLAEALSKQGLRVLVVYIATEQHQRLIRDLGFRTEEIIYNQPFKISSNLNLVFTENFCVQGSRDFLNSLQRSGLYDYILFDSPPVSHRIDSLLISHFVSNILFVIRTDVSKKRLVQQSVKQLKNSRSQFFGLVVNGVTSTREGYTSPHLLHEDKSSIAV